MPTAKIGLGVFLAVVGCLFALFTRPISCAWRCPTGSRCRCRGLLWFNTLVLVLSSVALQVALMAARRGQLETVRLGLATGGLTAVAFLVGQLFAWRELAGDGYLLASNPANSFFYLITGLHGLHIVGGLIGLARTIFRAWTGTPAPKARARRRTVRHVLAFPAVHLAGAVRAVCRLGCRLHRHLPPIAELGGPGG